MPLSEIVGSLTGIQGIDETVITIMAACLVLVFEMRNEMNGICRASTFKRYIPEVVGLTLLAVLSIGLRMKGFETEKPLDDEAWAEITKDWPLLMTADTLLAVQAMLRFLVFNSAILRSSGSRPALAPLPSALFLVGIAVRVALFFYSHAYHLDGPVGGKVALCFELASLFPLLALAVCGAWTRQGLGFLVMAMAGSAYVAAHNHFRLADDFLADSAFACAHCLELAAASIHLLHAGRGASLPGGGIVALGMPVQQVLSAYYFLEAFEAVPQLVGTGHPFELIWGAGCAQLGIFLCAGAVHLACLVEEVAPTPNAPVVTEEPMPRLSEIVF